MSELRSHHEQPSAPEDVQLEPERYELFEQLPYTFDFSRREFLTAAGAGVIVLVAMRNTALATTIADGSAAAQAVQQTASIGAWLHISEQGTVAAYTGKVEVGQDIRTSLTQHIAEELRLSPSRISLVMGDTDLTPFDQGTFGSRSTPQMGTQLRRAAAAARTTLLSLAASRWSVDVASLSIANGRITHAQSGRATGIGELTRGDRLVQTIAGDTPMTAPERWTTLGTSLAKISGRDIVTGKHRYTADMRLPGIHVGMVLRPPAIGARLVSLDTAPARAIPGAVVVHDGDFAGVAAPDEMTAARALAALRAEWSESPQPSHREVFDHLRRTARPGNATVRGSVETAMAQSPVTLEATYTTEYIAHVPLEPRAAVAQWDNGKLTVWTGTQRPFGVRTELASAFRIPVEQVRVLVPDTGSAYGGKHSGECAIEAARLARAAGQPVKLVWSREEEFTWAYFRPAALIDIRSAALSDGTLAAWDFSDYNAGTAGLQTPYNVSNSRTVFNQSDSPLRQGSYRALAAVANNFARETNMDELAVRAGIDPLQFRLRNLHEPRMRAVLEAAARRFGWTGNTAAPGRGIGIACGTEKGGFVATCAEVELERTGGDVRVVRIVAAFECGAVVNPDGLRTQVEGCIVMGLGGALWEAIEFESGRILNARLSQYRVPRMRDIPPIDVVLLDRKDLPSAGAGEAPIVAIAPALGNAIFSATGTRLRSLPLAPNGVRVLGS